MVPVIDQKVVFGRDQVVTSTHASKNFGEMRRRARKQPQFVSDRNDGIDTVIVSYDEFESMAVELENLRDEHLRSIAADRLAVAGGSDAIPIEKVMGEEAFAQLVHEESESRVSDRELFE